MDAYLPHTFYCAVCWEVFDEGLHEPKFLICHNRMCHSGCVVMLYNIICIIYCYLMNRNTVYSNSIKQSL